MRRERVTVSESELQGSHEPAEDGPDGEPDAPEVMAVPEAESLAEAGAELEAEAALEAQAAILAENEAEDDAAAADDQPETDGEETDGEEADGEETDPVTEFKAELRLLPGDWYVVHSYAGYENRVRTNLESRTQSLNRK